VILLYIIQRTITLDDVSKHTQTLFHCKVYGGRLLKEKQEHWINRKRKLFLHKYR